MSKKFEQNLSFLPSKVNKINKRNKEERKMKKTFWAKYLLMFYNIYQYFLLKEKLLIKNNKEV